MACKAGSSWNECRLRLTEPWSSARQQVRQWLQEDYPALVRRAKAEQGQVHWADETAVRQDTAWVRGYAPAGCTPVLEHAARRPSAGHQR